MCHALAVSSARFASFTLVATFHLDLPLVLVGESESVTATANSTNHHVKLAHLPPPGGVFRWGTTPNTANWAAQARAVPFSPNSDLPCFQTSGLGWNWPVCSRVMSSLVPVNHHCHMCGRLYSHTCYTRWIFCWFKAIKVPL